MENILITSKQNSGFEPLFKFIFAANSTINLRIQWLFYPAPLFNWLLLTTQYIHTHPLLFPPNIIQNAQRKHGEINMAKHLLKSKPK